MSDGLSNNENLENINFLKLQLYQMQLHTYISPNVFIMHHLSDKLIKSCDLNEHKFKVIREKSRGEGSLIVQDTIKNVSEPKFFFNFLRKKNYIF